MITSQVQKFYYSFDHNIVIIKICEQMKKQLESEIHSEWNDDAIQRKTENDAWFIFRTVFLQVLPC